MLFIPIIIPNTSAEDLQIDEECINNVLTLTVSDLLGPVNGISAYIYKDTSMEKISDKIVSDKNGKIKINFSEQTAMIKIIKENHEDIMKNLACDEEFRTQSVEVFSVVDSSIGIIKDPETGLTVVDLGTFYGMAGNGTIPDTIKVYRDNILWKTTTKETGIAPSTSHSEWQLPQTFFFNELPGKYKLVLITNDIETLVYEFLVMQITDKFDKNDGDANMTNNFVGDFGFFDSRLPPLKQVANGVSIKDVICDEKMQLVFKIANGNPACVSSKSAEKLIERGWAKF